MLGLALWHTKLSCRLERGHPMWAPILNPGCFTFDAAPCNVLGKQQQVALCPHGYLEGACDFWLQPGPALAFATIQKVNLQMKGHCLSLCVCVCI